MPKQPTWLQRLWCWLAHRRHRYCKPASDEPINEWLVGCRKCGWERETLL